LSTPMKRVLAASLLTTLALAFALPAAASAEEDHYIQQARKQHSLKKFDFTGEDVDGTVVRPDGVDLRVLEWVTHASLIRIRRSFDEKILRSTEDM